MSQKKYVYNFAEGNTRMRSLLGGKGANLAEMTGLGIPVPPGFIVTTEGSVALVRAPVRYPDGLGEEIEEHLHALENFTASVSGTPAIPSCCRSARARCSPCRA